MIEGAFLAGLVRIPSGYDPIRDPERVPGPVRQVAERLADVGLRGPIGGRCSAETWMMPDRVHTIPRYTTTPTYYTEALKEYLLERRRSWAHEQATRANLLYRGGLRIHTTFDPNLQALAEQARNEVLPANAAGIDAAIVTLDTKTGAIRAMVGGRGFAARREINMALRATARPGSHSSSSSSPPPSQAGR